MSVKIHLEECYRKTEQRFYMYSAKSNMVIDHLLDEVKKDNTKSNFNKTCTENLAKAVLTPSMP